MRGKREVEIQKEIPFVREEESSNGNGAIIPVIYEEVSVWYDVKKKEYFVHAKIANKKYTFAEDKS